MLQQRLEKEKDLPSSSLSKSAGIHAFANPVTLSPPNSDNSIASQLRKVRDLSMSDSFSSGPTQVILSASFRETPHLPVMTSAIAQGDEDLVHSSDSEPEGSSSSRLPSSKRGHREQLRGLRIGEDLDEEDENRVRVRVGSSTNGGLSRDFSGRGFDSESVEDDALTPTAAPSELSTSENLQPEAPRTLYQSDDVFGGGGSET
jgi:hypothetical protein